MLFSVPGTASTSERPSFSVERPRSMRIRDGGSALGGLAAATT